MIRHSPFVIRHFSLTILLAGAALLSACYERKDAAVINPDGSGKISIDVDIAVAAGDHQKPDVLGTGRLFAANLINGTRGVDAWSDVAVTEAADGRAHIAATAYFPDLNKLKLDVPLEFAWKRDVDGAVFTIVRTHAPLRAAENKPTAAQIKELVKQAQDQYKQSQPLLQVQLGAYKEGVAFELPGELSNEHLLTRDGSTVSFDLDGKKVAKAMDQIMANDAALATTFANGADNDGNDDILLQSMFGQKGPVSVHVKFPDGAKPVFDYKTEMRVAQLQETDVLKAAGVELVPKFIVKDSATTTSKPK